MALQPATQEKVHAPRKLTPASGIQIDLHTNLNRATVYTADQNFRIGKEWHAIYDVGGLEILSEPSAPFQKEFVWVCYKGKGQSGDVHPIAARCEES
jgi:hypothetical protein